MTKPERFSNFARTTLDGSIDDSQTTLVVAAGAVFPSDGDFRLHVDDELMIVGSRSGNTLSDIIRGAEGTTPAAHTDGVAVTHPLTAGALRALITSTGSMVFVYRTEDQTIPTATDTAITWPSGSATEEKDTDDFHSMASNTSRFVAPWPGVYVIQCGNVWDPSGAGLRNIWIRKNGSVGYARMTIDSSGGNDRISTGVVIWLEAGDYVEMMVRQATGDSLAVVASSRYTFFSMAAINGAGGIGGDAGPTGARMGGKFPRPSPGSEPVVFTMPWAGSFDSWTVLNDSSGSIQFDVWKDTYGNYPPTVADSITASDKPKTTSAIKATGDCTGWGAFAEGDVVAIKVDSAIGVGWSTVILELTPD